MRRVSLFWCLAFGFASEAQDIDVLHYNFVLRLSDTSDLIDGYTEITFIAKHNASTVSFDLVNEKQDGKGMRVFNAQSIRPNRNALSFRHENDKVTLSFSLKSGDTAIAAVWYKGIPSDGLIISKNQHGDRTFFADNWPNRAHHWIVCNDRPDDKATFGFTVEAPAAYQVISNGILTTKSFPNEGKAITAWQEDTPLSTKVMVIGVAKFATKVYDNSPSGVPVSAWVYPQDSAKGFYDYAQAVDIVKFFSSYIAPFPFNKLANVQSKTIFGGMENASCIFYAENTVTGDRSNESLLAHEIAHQWFGDAASEKSFAHLWLSEGFATFLTNYYFEKKYGKDSVQKRWAQQREEVVAFAIPSNRPVVDTTTDLMSLLNANSYQKGAWVLHMLRQEVGDSTFQKIIQTYYNQYKGGNAESRDFEAVAKEVSGKELTPFFDQWLYRPGVPRLKITFTVKGKEMHVSVLQSGEPYGFVLPLQVQSADGPAIVTFTVKDRLSLFKIPVRDKNAKLVVDPRTMLLFALEK